MNSWKRKDMSPLARLDAARQRLRIAEADCAHWDYETDGHGHACCDEMTEAREELRAARAAVKRLHYAPAAREVNEHDYEIMRARTLATGRGATPAEIQHNVARFESDAFPIPVMRGFGART